MFTFRIRFDTFCTVPVIAISAPRRLAKLVSQPPQACRLLPRASLATGVMSRSVNRPDSASRRRNWSLRRTRRACSSARGPLVSPSRLVSINSKSNAATVCASLEAHATPIKTHDIAAYDAIRTIAPRRAKPQCAQELWPIDHRLTILVVACTDDIDPAAAARQDDRRWFPQGIKRERGACARAQCRGCPRNCKRRASDPLPLGTRFLGRRSAAMNREPGDLPPLESRAGALGGVSCCS